MDLPTLVTTGVLLPLKKKAQNRKRDVKTAAAVSTKGRLDCFAGRLNESIVVAFKSCYMRHHASFPIYRDSRDRVQPLQLKFCW